MLLPPHPPSPPDSGQEYVIGLGGNLGDRVAALAAGARAVGRLGSISGVSSLFETDPVGGPAQGRYLNAAILLRTPGSPKWLLDGLLSVEIALGRVRRERWEPRLIDLDLLWAGEVVLADPELVLPHPRLRERAFALIPLLELVPDACDPLTREPYAAALERVTWTGVRRVGAFVIPGVHSQ
ncbi:MAG: 2-amino-4-hydroxy-6-hydroxymethyldihydropteridine diphosphokinase [Polyangiaceae bacterium]|nr:2-amino-4-hydroxy-6-hydroxymethyldihydropteridine diphosphokinase [Polyangiaceae bacterium]